MTNPTSAVYSIGMGTRFRGLTRREGMLVHGPAGWGEFSPFWDYDEQTSRPWWQAASEAAQIGWPSPVRERIEVNVTVPAVGPQTAAQIVTDSQGCRTAKVKVAEPGQTVAQEQERLEAVRSALGASGKIRIDANGAWDTETALARLDLLDRAAGGLEYVEQPCATMPELASVRRRQEVRVAADESIRGAQDPMAVARAEAADVVVLKVQPLGGVRPAMQIAEQIGLPVVVSSAVETSIGIRAGIALAAALPELPYACGLATVHLLDDDVVADPLLPRDGAIEVRDVRPDPEALARCLADEPTTGQWRTRLAAVAAREETR